MRPSLEIARKRNEGLPILGAEIGVAIGDNASEILKSWPEVKLILCDGYWHSLEWAKRTQERLAQFNDRITWYIMDSQEASREIQDNSLDFVYIDASHTYRDCYMDIRVWYPKIKPEGVLCGHDFFSEPGTRQAVCEFVKDNNLELHAKWADDWWIIKP